MALLTWPAQALKREKIQWSSKASPSGVKPAGLLGIHGSTPHVSMFKKRNRDAFQILLAKALELSRRSGENTISVPGAAPLSNAIRTASVPYSSVTRSGSITLPLVFDIFC